MAQKIYLKDSDLGLGAFSFPVLTFNERMAELKQRNPQLNDEERAAVVYFGMLADTPQPTTENKVYYLEPQNGPFKQFEANNNPENWLDIEKTLKYSGVAGALYRSALTESEPATGYYNNVLRLQYWISYNGLWNGIHKTLMEQNRKLQGLRAGIEASKAAAAKALGLSQITDEMTDAARVEAAQAQAQAQKQYDEAIERENVLNKQLDNISKGLPADFRSGDTWAGGVPVLPLVIGGIFIFLLGERKGKKAAR